MTAADILGMELDQGEGKLLPLHILKKRGKVPIGLWMIFIFHLGLFHTSQVFHNGYILFQNQK